jgi:DNA-binding GntR family transcriptional regulator
LKEDQLTVSEGRVRRPAYDADKLMAIANDVRSVRSTAQDVVLESLRRAILRGVFPPGTRLRQEELAEIFAAGSRIPVREALHVLQHEGLVDSEPHRGFTVTALSAQEIEEIYEIRTALEGHALRIAIPLLTDSDLDQLRELYEGMERESDANRQLELRERFYTQLYSVTGRPRLVALISRLRQDVGRSLRKRLVVDSPRHHEVLFKAISEGDTELAIAELASHYRKVAGHIRRVLADGQ